MRGERDGLADKPGFVPAGRYRRCRRQSSISGNRCRFPPAAYPDARAGSPQTHPVWPCSGWGLPSRSGHPERWWSLTPPFHPYRWAVIPAKSGKLHAAVSFLWHWPAGFPEWALPTTLLCGARTFLGGTLSKKGTNAIAWPTRPASMLPPPLGSPGSPHPAGELTGLA